MKTFETLNGVRDQDVEMIASRFDFLLREVSPLSQEQRFADDNTGYQLPPGTPLTIQRYPVRRVSASQGRAFARQLARLVLEERSYNQSVIKGCAFSPGVAFRVWARKRAVDVLLCFHCDQMAVGSVGGSEERY